MRFARRASIAACAAALAMLAAAPAASAHAVLEDTSPARDEILERSPGQVVFLFSEPVESSFGAVRLFDSRGNPVEAGDVIRPKGQDSIGVQLDDGLRDGTYTATFRIVSADSHPVSGGLVFSVGTPSASFKPISELTANDAGTVTDVGFGIARGVAYAATALAIGGIVFLLLVWARALAATGGSDVRWRDASERFARRLRTILLVGLAAGLVASAAQIAFQGAAAGGTSFWSALDRDVIGDVLDTRFGKVRLIECGVFAGMLLLVTARGWVPALRPASVGATGLALSARPGALELGVIVLLLGFLASGPSIAGHASTQSPTELLIPTDIVHVVAMSVWLGGLVVLVLALPAATRALEPADRTRLLAASFLRFSPLALAAVIALLASGLVQSYVHVRSIDRLIETGFGRAVLIKFGLMLVLIAFGVWNRRRGLPRLKSLAAAGEAPGGAGFSFRRSLRAEVLLIAVVLGVTSLLVSYAPPVNSTSSGPFSTTEELGPVEMQMTVDPATSGRNEMHFYLTDPERGAQFTRTKEFRVRLSLPEKDVGPLDADARKAGPGHYVVPGAPFIPGGDWEVKVTDRVSEFDQYETTVEVPIR